MAGSAAVEEYCEAIFELREDDLSVIQARIADRLQVSRPAVSEMIKRMAADGLVALDGGIRLTAPGTRLAEQVVRRHRLAERFLTDVLGLSWAEAHQEATRWEHVLTDNVEAAMNRLLGDPTTCPHGNPIPGSGYEVPDTVVLGEVPPGSAFVVTRIPEELEFADGVLEFLEEANLLPGTAGTVTHAAPDGTVTVCVDERHVGIGAFASARILVIASDPAEPIAGDRAPAEPHEGARPAGEGATGRPRT